MRYNSFSLWLSRFRNFVYAEWHYVCAHLGIYHFTHYPCFVNIEPANFCTLHCPECPVGNSDLRTVKRSPRTMDMTIYIDILQQFSPYIHTIQFFFQGEPLLHPRLPEMIRLARQQGLYTIVSTNAQQLNESMAEAIVQSGLNRIIVSLDSLDERSYQAYRKNGSLSQCLQGIRFLRQFKERQRSNLHIEIQCLRLRSNEGEWSRFEKEYRLLGADSLTFKTAQLYDYKDGHSLMPTLERYSRYRKGRDGKYFLYRPWWKSSICHRLFTGCIIDTDGNMLPCCFDKNEQHKFGSVRESGMHSCWHSKPAESFRRSVLTNRAVVSICGNCTE